MATLTVVGTGIAIGEHLTPAGTRRLRACRRGSLPRRRPGGRRRSSSSSTRERDRSTRSTGAAKPRLETYEAMVEEILVARCGQGRTRLRRVLRAPGRLRVSGPEGDRARPRRGLPGVDAARDLVARLPLVRPRHRPGARPAARSTRRRSSSSSGDRPTLRRRLSSFRSTSSGSTTTAAARLVAAARARRLPEGVLSRRPRGDRLRGIPVSDHAAGDRARGARRARGRKPPARDDARRTSGDEAPADVAMARRLGIEAGA